MKFDVTCYWKLLQSISFLVVPVVLAHLIRLRKTKGRKPTGHYLQSEGAKGEVKTHEGEK